MFSADGPISHLCSASANVNIHLASLWNIYYCTGQAFKEFQHIRTHYSIVCRHGQSFRSSRMKTKRQWLKLLNNRKVTRSFEMDETDTDSLEQHPSWQPDNTFSYLRNSSPFVELKGSFHIHKSPPLVPILRHINPPNNLPPCFLKIYFNSLLSSSRCSK